MRRIAMLLLAFALAVPASVGAKPKTREVAVGDNFFKPTDVKVKVGDAVHWSRDEAGAQHNVSEEHGIFRNGEPDGAVFEFTVTFSAGTFPYFCEVHGGPGGAGMSGVIRVPVAVSDAPSGVRFTVRWATPDTDSGDAFDVQYRVGGKWKRWLKDTEALKRVLGKGGKPVAVKAGTTYQLRARTRTAAGGTGDWSPVQTFTA